MLVSNSQRSVCLCLLSAGIKGVRHHRHPAENLFLEKHKQTNKQIIHPLIQCRNTVNFASIYLAFEFFETGFHHQPKVSWHSLFCPKWPPTVNSSSASSCLCSGVRAATPVWDFFLVLGQDWPWTQRSTTSTSPVLGLKSCATLPGFRFFFLSLILIF